MSLCHVVRDKVSFVDTPGRADITGQRLTLGGDNVHLHTRIDDESSWFRTLGPDQRNPPRLADAPAPAPRADAMDRARSARRRPVLERRGVRGRKTVLAGVNAAKAGVASEEGRRPKLLKLAGARHDCHSS